MFMERRDMDYMGQKIRWAVTHGVLGLLTGGLGYRTAKDMAFVRQNPRLRILGGLVPLVGFWAAAAANFGQANKVLEKYEDRLDAYVRGSQDLAVLDPSGLVFADFVEHRMGLEAKEYEAEMKRAHS